MARKLSAEDVSLSEKTICPSPEELSVVTNNVRCDQCGLVFRNQSQYRLHDLKVHQHKNLDKIAKENVRYHCPVQSCVYAVNCQRYFSTMKYLKQHYLKVHAEKTYACSRCSKTFSTEAAKDGHMRVCGIEFTCSCSKTYTTYEALLTHAKRSLHIITDKYKSLSRRKNLKAMQIVLPTGNVNKPIMILPSSEKPGKNSENVSTQKSTCDVGVQTDDYKKHKKIFSPLKSVNNSHCHAKRRISKQTQTNSFHKEKDHGKSTETQTIKLPQAVKETLKMHKRRESRTLPKRSEHALLKEDLNLADNFTSTNLFPASPLPLRHDVGLQDFWEEKSTSGTQTIPEKDIFEAFNDNVTQTEFESFYEHSHNSLMQCSSKCTVALMTLPYTEDTSAVGGYAFSSTDRISQADPMLTAKTFDDKFSSIETQTEQAFSPSYFYPESLSRSFALSSNIETQTTDNLDNMELLYSNTYTQTCSEILSSDLGLSDIQTQTAWTHDDTTVSTETQTKSLICESGCNIAIGTCRSWLNTQTSHTETQTDLLSIFEELQ